MSGIRIFVVEDQYLIGEDIATMLRDAGMDIVGPVGSINDALVALETAKCDAALLDIKLHDGRSFAIAAALQKKAIPFAFITGYDRKVLPKEFCNVPLLGKPINAARVIALVRGLCANSALPSFIPPKIETQAAIEGAD